MNKRSKPASAAPTGAEPAASDSADTPCWSEGRAPELTVIVPVYNEERTIDELLCRVLAAPYTKQVIVVDDGSTDGTGEALKAWHNRPEIEVFEHFTNRGKGAAIRTGLEHARGRFVIIQDGDLEYDPQEYPRLVEPLLSGETEVVYGSRRLGRGRCWRDLHNPFYHGVSLLDACARLLYGARLTDEATCFKVFPTNVLRAMDLQCNGFEFCPEVTAKACRMGLEITEVPIRYEARTIQAGKKIRWTDGLAALRALWRWRKWRPREAEADEHGMSNGLLANRPARHSAPTSVEARFGKEGGRHVAARE